MKLTLIVSVLSIFLSSCTYRAINDDHLDGEIVNLSRDNISAAKIASDRTVKNLQSTFLVTQTVPPSTPNINLVSNSLNNSINSASLANDLVSRTETLLGASRSNQAQRVNSLLSTNELIKSNAVSIEESLISREAQLRQEQAEIREKLQDMGYKYEEQKNNKIVSWSWSSVAVLGMGALFTFIGPLSASFPIVSKILRIVPIKFLDNKIGAIGEIRSALKHFTDNDPEKTLKPKEVLAKIDTELRNKEDNKDNKFVSQRRRELGHK